MSRETATSVEPDRAVASQPAAKKAQKTLKSKTLPTEQSSAADEMQTADMEEGDEDAAAGGPSSDLLARFPSFENGKKMNLIELFIPDPIKVERTHRRLDEEDEHAIRLLPSESMLRQELETLPPGRLERWARGAKVGRNRERRSVENESRRIWQLASKFQSSSDDQSVDPNGPKETAAAVDGAPPKLSTFELIDWESRVVSDLADSHVAKKRRTGNFLETVNDELENGDWMQNIVGLGDDRSDQGNQHVEHEKDAPSLEDSISTSYALLALLRQPHPDPVSGRLLDPLNISNDSLYVAVKPNKVRTSDGLTAVDIKHSKLATELQQPFYRIDMRQDDLRSMYRHQILFPINIPFHFEKLWAAGRPQRSKTLATLGGNAKKDAILDIPRNTRELSMADRYPIVLFEYSEQHPPVLSSYGMGHVITNYYRKRHEQDESFTQPNLLPSYNPMLYPGPSGTHPRRHLTGQLSVLHPDNPQPYNLAFIRQGEYMQSLESNMTRAPIFEQRPEPTDFLVIRQTEEGRQPRYFIKRIDNLYVVGQTYPRMPVPIPTSNEVRDMRKKRLYDTVRRLLKRSADGTVGSQQLKRLYPRQDLQMLLRSFMSQSASSGTSKARRWKLIEHAESTQKKSLDSLDDKIATPEEHAIIASMDHAKQLLEDAGYRLPNSVKEEKALKKRADMAKEADEPVAMPLELQLAPWYTTLSYFKASPIKYTGGAFQPMLELSGPGDPTGRREGFSMLEKYRKQAVQEYSGWLKDRLGRNKFTKDDWALAYEYEQRDIWERQKRALCNPIPPDLTEEDEWEDEDEEEDAEQYSSASGGSFLVIQRVNDSGEHEEEVIRDEAVITAYLVKKATIDPAAVTTLIQEHPQRLAGVKEKLEQYARTYTEIEERKREAEAAREKARAEMAFDKRGPKRPPTCQECGQVGHTKKQKDKCPGRPKGLVAPTAAELVATPAEPVGLGKIKLKKAGGNPSTSSPATGGGLKLKLGGLAKKQTKTKEEEE